MVRRVDTQISSEHRGEWGAVRVRTFINDEGGLELPEFLALYHSILYGLMLAGGGALLIIGVEVPGWAETLMEIVGWNQGAVFVAVLGGRMLSGQGFNLLSAFPSRRRGASVLSQQMVSEVPQDLGPQTYEEEGGESERIIRY